MNEQNKTDSIALPADVPDTSLAVVPHDPWQAIRRFTPARIALGRAGNALPTREVLRFSLAHALARDAVHWQLDLDQLQEELQHDGFQSVLVHSAVQDRTTYLLRPDQGRRLGAGGVAALTAADGPGCDLALVLADGLSAIAVQKHAVPLLRALRPLLPPDWSLAPVVIAQQARVALGDEIGQCLRAKMVVMLIGERPGLSSPDSLGAYLTSEPRVGRMDSERNCVSNIRPQGLNIEAAARRIAWLLLQGRKLGLTGVALKDESGGLPAVRDDTAGN
ncbi:ethanolamine ammonia-lyase subunit EutC [Lacisediminimonas profundi]|uniref:ethanolamine ammonia-lyase subunit EutC n=1 Tax=Lacisediminimonas profundi TaxID=2603856 RepID=UPI00124B2A05|nr:ethanolamine ammonia-lyase subunit EutC [Lacisediminimonas profundi]